MRRLSGFVLPVLLVLLSGCAENIYNLTVPAPTQADQYVETDDLGKIRLKPRIGFMDDQIDAIGRRWRALGKARFDLIKPS